MPTISGTVVDGSSNPVARRVSAYLQGSGAIQGVATSNSITGAYSISVPTSAAHRVICEDAEPDASCNLLMHFDGTNNSTVFVEETGKSITRNGTPIISTAQSVFGGASGYFDGVGDYLTISGVNPLGSGDFTVDFRFYLSQVGKSCFILDTRTANEEVEGFIFYARGTNKLAFWTGNPGAAVEGVTTLVANQFYHARLSRSGTTIRGFLNGGLEFSLVSSVNFSRTSWLCGQDIVKTNNGGAFYVDELFVWAAAINTTDESFTVPTTPFSHVTSYGKNALVFDSVIPV